jgi:hypothetical protein
MDVLGRGGMGVVYKARHLALKRTVALKMVLAGGHAGPRELTRFRTEAEAVARLQHPNIVQIHEVGEADGHPYCALEFVEGGTLAQKLLGKPLPVREAATLAETLARAMQAAHARSVIHRDLKPANVLLTLESCNQAHPGAIGTPKITDFGLARQLDADSGETQPGAVMGTPSYMAPEQAGGRAHEAGPPADVYALGAILYECLTGRPPFRGGSVAETLVLVRTADPVPISRVRTRVPRDLETICLKAMAKDPARRYATAGDLADDLRRFLADEPILARRAGAGERLWRRIRRNPVVTGLSALVLALAVVAGVFALRPRPEPPDPTPPAEDTSADELLKVVADLDRTDPGWRLVLVEEKRPEISADENGALQIGKFRKAVAALTGRPKSEGTWFRPELGKQMYALPTLPPDVAVPAEDVTAFRAELVRVESLLPVARKMTDYPQGRFATAGSRDAVSTLLPEHQTGRHLALLLDLDAKLQLHNGNRPQALNDCRAMWNVGRGYLGEPRAVVQLIRIAVIRMSLRTFERSLANGQCTDAELAEFQGLIDEATRVPVFATMMRGERGVIHYFLSSLASGDLPDRSILDMLGIKDRAELPAAKDIRRLHAWLLVYTTDTVGIASRPPEQWAALIGPHDENRKSAPLADNRLVQLFTTDVLNEGPVQHSTASRFAAQVLLHQAELRTALAALAVERYRLAHGGWPKALGDLVPASITEVPSDPHNGQPLRYRRTEDGVVVYSVGPDGIDDHGALSRVAAPPSGTDVGFRLWDADRRR